MYAHSWTLTFSAPLTAIDPTLWGSGSQGASGLAASSPCSPLGSLGEPSWGSQARPAPPPPPRLSIQPLPQTLTWVWLWPGTTPGSAEPSLPSSPLTRACEPKRPVWSCGRGLRGGAGEQVRLVWAGGAAWLGLGQCWGTLSTSQDELFTSLRLLRCTPLPPSSCTQPRRCSSRWGTAAKH